MNYLDLFKKREDVQSIRQKIAEFEKETNVVFPHISEFLLKTMIPYIT